LEDLKFEIDDIYDNMPENQETIELLYQSSSTKKDLLADLKQDLKEVIEHRYDIDEINQELSQLKDLHFVKLSNFIDMMPLK